MADLTLTRDELTIVVAGGAAEMLRSQIAHLEGLAEKYFYDSDRDTDEERAYVEAFRDGMTYAITQLRISLTTLKGKI